jgi:hypothetical protein
MTLIKDDRRQVPLTVARDAPVLYLSVLDYPSGWQIAAPSRTFIPELKKRWPQVTAIEVSDHTPLSELNLVRAMVPRFSAVVASVFVRATSGSGRLDMSAEIVRLLRDLARTTSRTNTPLVATFFGNRTRPQSCRNRRGDAHLRLPRSRGGVGRPCDLASRRSAAGCPSRSRNVPGRARPDRPARAVSPQP